VKFSSLELDRKIKLEKIWLLKSSTKILSPSILILGFDFSLFKSGLLIT
jgi:hypothetical protein